MLGAADAVMVHLPQLGTVALVWPVVHRTSNFYLDFIRLREYTLINCQVCSKGNAHATDELWMPEI